MSKIKRLLQSEISNLLEKSNAFDVVDHNATKGAIREELLIEFFKSLIPNKLSITGGLVCDYSGNTSRQTDFIIYDKELTPSFALGNNASMVPVENVYLTAEIKSTLRTEDLDQVATSIKKLSELKLTGNKSNDNLLVPFNIIVAYDSKISKESLKNWLKDNPNTLSICILEKYTLSQSKKEKEIETFKNNQRDIEYYETLCFYTQMFNFLKEQIQLRKNFTPHWNAYILDL